MVGQVPPGECVSDMGLTAHQHKKAISRRLPTWCLRQNVDGWKTDAIFILFNSISVISERWEGVVKEYVQWSPVYSRKDFRSQRD